MTTKPSTAGIAVRTVPLARATEHGGKAAGLAQLLGDGEVVPAGFVIAFGDVDGLDVADLSAPLAALHADRVAVRSSGTGEDRAESSLAGAHLTLLDVPANASAVLDAVRRVHASGTEVSVIVQAMVTPRAAGVAFSANPVTGDDEVVLTAVAGLADALVSGEVEGETWTVRADGLSGPGDGAVLSGADVDQVAAMVRRLADRRGHHVDVEWAITDNALVALQCRPVTALPVAPEIVVPPGTWEKDVAHSPGPLSPMTASIGMMDADMFAAWTARFGFVVKSLRLEYFGGEEYSQVVPIIGDPAKPGGNPPWWLLGALSRIVPPVRARMKTARSVLDSGLLEELPLRWEREWKPEFEAAIARLRDTDVAALTDAELLVHAEEARDLLHRGVEIHFDLFVPYLVEVHQFVQVADRLLGWDSSQCLAALAGRSPASYEGSRQLREIAAAIQADPAAAAVLEDAGVRELAVLLERLDDLAPAIAAAVRTWVEVDGFRTTDYDVASPTVAEIPGLVTQLLRGAVAHEEPDGAADDPLADALSGRGETDRAEVRRAFDRACAVFGLREDNVRLIGLVPIAALRRALLEMGRRAVARGLLADLELTMMLRWSELTAVLTGSTADLTPTARRRRAEHAWVAAHPGPLHHGPEPIPPPDMRGLPRAGRILNQALMWAISEEMAPPPERTGDGVRGTGCGSGSYTGPVRVVRTAAEFGRVQPGDVLVCPIATPAWSALFSIVGAVVCDGGGPLSHTAIVAREHRLPVVMGAGNATSVLRDGDVVTVDGATGVIVTA